MGLKVLAIAMIFTGEAASIYAELLAARRFTAPQASWAAVFLKMLVVIVVGMAALLAGYMLGIKAFQNIWIVSVASITSILIIEPVLIYGLFGQMPTAGALVGLVLGGIGFAAAIFF